ncbi:hypothetical protein C0991_011579 [Blastosporella zonata]|nr:hypothetical protein C0991_011579 [Blastosporella zonata]
MFSSKAVSFVALLLCVSQASAASLARPLVARASDLDARGTIPALLRSGHKAGTIVRRGTCSIGSFACADGTGCCPDTQYCGEWDGELGCCPIGEICGSGNDSTCTKSGYNVCAAENFCCPAGGLCGRDANDNPECFTANGAPASVDYTTTAAAAHTSTTIAVAHTSTSTKTSIIVQTTSENYLTITSLPAVTIIGGGLTTSSPSPTVYTFASTTITGPLHNGGDDEPTSSASAPLSKQYRGLVPAIGGLTHIRTSPSIGSQFELPPSPEAPSPEPAVPPHVKAYDIDPASLLPGVIDDLAAVAQAWQIDTHRGSDDIFSRPFDVLGVLTTTTRTIRSIRNYLLSLGDESASTIRAHFRPNLLSKSQNATPSSSQPDPLSLIRKSALEVLTVLREVEERWRLPLSDDAYDVHSDGGSRSRMTSPANILEDLPPDEDSQYAHLDADTSITFSVVQVKGKLQTVPVWEDEDDEFEQPEDEKEKREPWDERLVVGSGWLYRQDVKLAELENERKVIAEYLDVVDEVLFEWKRNEEGKERGWEREKRKVVEKGDRSLSRAKARRVSTGDSHKELTAAGMLLVPPGKRRVSTGMLNSMSEMTLTEEPESIPEDEEEEVSVDDEELPLWAQRSSFVHDELGRAPLYLCHVTSLTTPSGRAHAFLEAFLPSNLLPSLRAPTTAGDEFLESLSSGQLLCVAYNACVRKSKHPWGYVSRDGIHDILALEQAAMVDGNASEGGKKGWTFRRTDNLRLWAGALKLRYMLPVQVPSHTVQGLGVGTPSIIATVPSSPMRRTSEPPVFFDAKVVAKKEDGWEDMLEAVLLKWVAKAVEEKRNAH